MNEHQHKKRLEQARQTGRANNLTKKNSSTQKTIKESKEVIKNISNPVSFFSLFFQMSIFTDWMYGVALLAAVLKDILDLLEVTGIWYIIVIVLTFCVSIFIALMMLLGNSVNGVGKGQRKMIKSWLVLLAGTSAELIFGIDLLPIETLTVIIIYLMLLSARKTQQQILNAK